VRRRGTNWAAAAVAAALFAFSFYALQRWLEHGSLSDVPLYQHYATLVRGGAVPYRDFTFEYPPVSLAALLVPAYMSWSYATSFAVLMGVCGAGCIALVATALRDLEAGPARTWAALLLIGISPILLGSLFDTRFDLWPTLLAVGALAALVQERPLVTGALLGLGFAAKLWPAVLLPIAVVFLWRRRGAGSALAALVAFVLVAAACFAPFMILAPDGLRAMFADQLDRPLQVESLGAAVLMAAHHLGLRPLTTISTHGAQALKGRGAGLAADLSTALELTAVLVIWILFARLLRPRAEDALVASAATLGALVAFDKVLSPQYLIWLVPIVALVAGTSGVLVGCLVAVALGLTQTWFPAHYWSLALDYASPWWWYLLARDLALVALAAVLIIALNRERDFAGRRGDWPVVRRAAA
jgi:Glycosyltransferase family 87